MDRASEVGADRFGASGEEALREEDAGLDGHGRQLGLVLEHVADGVHVRGRGLLQHRRKLAVLRGPNHSHGTQVQTSRGWSQLQICN
jgi:hypothetical protein